jgi:hypothetical protein
MEKMGDRNSYMERVMNVLAESNMPMGVENVRTGVGLKNWESTKALLLEMVLQGNILGEKTTRGWIFWAESPTTSHATKRR